MRIYSFQEAVKAWITANFNKIDMDIFSKIISRISIYCHAFQNQSVSYECRCTWFRWAPSGTLQDPRVHFGEPILHFGDPRVQFRGTSSTIGYKLS